MEKSPSDVEATLAKVMGGLLEHAQAERRKEVPYQMLFGAFKDSGIAAAVFEAQEKMEQVALDLIQVLEDATGKEVDSELFQVVMGLPLAALLTEWDVQKHDGSVCCVDKSSLLLRTYMYEKLGIDVEQTPFKARPSRRPEQAESKDE